MKRLCLVGHLVHAASDDGPSAAQQRLSEVLEEINLERERNRLIAPLTIMAKDRFEAAFGAAERLWPVIFRIESHLHPISIRWAIAVGDLEMLPTPDQVSGIDGPACHLAREAIETVNRAGGCYRLAGLPESDLPLIDSCLDLIAHQRRRWTLNRLMIFRYLLSGYSIPEVTRLVALKDQQAVNQRIEEGALMPIAAVFHDLSRRLDQCLSAHD